MYEFFIMDAIFLILTCDIGVQLAAKTKGVFINPAFIEPFGLTLIEAAAYGLPMVATKNGRPVDIQRDHGNSSRSDTTVECKGKMIMMELHITVYTSVGFDIALSPTIAVCYVGSRGSQGFSNMRLEAHDKEGTRADVSALDWSANDWLAPEGTKMLSTDQSGANTSTLVSPYHILEKL
ncbi:probable sucrose-phosphate synthase [Tanacetum coccineum]|uniref:sucrose-phosphate synthase n=1 Tax=Tanacetum coccineum TaxID=301880 RepID=A0ABQ4WMD1_9ASTR